MAETHKSNPRANVMVAADVIGLIACVWALVTLALEGKLDAATASVLTTFGTFFGLSLRDAHNFEFSSSRGSRDKDAAMAAVIEKQTDATTATATAQAETIAGLAAKPPEPKP